MKKTVIFGMLMALCMLAVSFAFASGNAEKGKALFNDPGFAGGSRSCNSCHTDGEGLEHAGTKKEFTISGRKANRLEDAVNICIVGANGGKAIKTDSAEMMDIVAYIKSIGANPKGPGSDY